MELRSLDDDARGGRVRMVGPLGMGRIARTRVVSVEEPVRLRGTADVGYRTRGVVQWDIAPDGGGSGVTLSARVERASLLDRALLLVGGKRWLERTFAHAVARLGDAVPRD